MTATRVPPPLPDVPVLPRPVPFAGEADAIPSPFEAAIEGGGAQLTDTCLDVLVETASPPTPARLRVGGAVAASAAWSCLVASVARRDPDRRARPDATSPPSEGGWAEPSPAGSGDACLHGAAPVVSVVIAARDEAETLPELLADLAAQDLRSADGAARFDVTIVDDGSGDATPDVIAAFRRDTCVPIVRVVRRPRGATGGKGGALRAVPPHLLRGALVCVLDADARVGASFLRQAVGEGAAHPAVTARRRILGREVTRWAALQDDEQTADAFIQRGRRALGGCTEFRGDGIIVGRHLLERAGGWAADTLTEDLDLSSRLAVAGIVVAVPRGLVVEETPVADPRSLWVQRMRWAEGSLRRYLAHGPAVLRSPRLSRGARLEFAVYAAQLSIPPLWLGAAVAGIVARRPRVAAAIGMAYAVGGAATAYGALAGDGTGASAVQLAARSVAVAAFGASWAAIVPAAFLRLAMRRRPAPHDRTPHHRVIGTPRSPACTEPCAPGAGSPATPPGGPEGLPESRTAHA